MFKQLIAVHKADGSSGDALGRPDFHGSVGVYHWTRLDDGHIYVNAWLNKKVLPIFEDHATHVLLPSVHDSLPVDLHLEALGKIAHSVGLKTFMNRPEIVAKHSARNMGFPGVTIKAGAARSDTAFDIARKMYVATGCPAYLNFE